MNPPRVLMVEDNPIDVRMIKRALKVGGWQQEPMVVNDGAPAISLLKRENEFKDAELPDLVLLDLNLITVDGGEVLDFIRQTPALDNIAVAILSSTPQDLSSRRNSKADCYFMKPSSIEGFERLGKQILDCYANSKRNASF